MNGLSSSNQMWLALEKLMDCPLPHLITRGKDAKPDAINHLPFGDGDGWC
jgi:hypothetical protein